MRVVVMVIGRRCRGLNHFTTARRLAEERDLGIVGHKQRVFVGLKAPLLLEYGTVVKLD